MIREMIERLEALEIAMNQRLDAWIERHFPRMFEIDNACAEWLHKRALRLQTAFLRGWCRVEWPEERHPNGIDVRGGPVLFVPSNRQNEGHSVITPLQLDLSDQVNNDRDGKTDEAKGNINAQSNDFPLVRPNEE